MLLSCQSSLLGIAAAHSEVPGETSGSQEGGGGGEKEKMETNPIPINRLLKLVSEKIPANTKGCI